MTPRRSIAIGAILTAAGLALAAVAPIAGLAPAARVDLQQSVGGVMVVAGWAVLGYGIHKLGRESSKSSGDAGAARGDQGRS